MKQGFWRQSRHKDITHDDLQTFRRKSTGDSTSAPVKYTIRVYLLFLFILFILFLFSETIVVFGDEYRQMFFVFFIFIFFAPCVFILFTRISTTQNNAITDYVCRSDAGSNAGKNSTK